LDQIVIPSNAGTQRLCNPPKTLGFALRRNDESSVEPHLREATDVANRVSNQPRRFAMEVFGGTHGIFMTFIIGLIVGIIAKFLTPGRNPGGFIITAVIGIVGSFVATWLGKEFHWYQPGQSAGFMGSVIGAIILLVVYHLVRRNSASP
jgi:uncharacterized membrane protein YeaQ/YmgE (transglycosylase-associated protein family)